jgi:hypothetical protein
MDERRPLPRSAVRRSTQRDLHAVADVQTLDLGAIGHRPPFDLRPLDHHITPIEELTEQGPIRLEPAPVGTPCGARRLSLTRPPSPDRGVVITLALADIDEISKRLRLVN